ncbi:MAG: XrtA system polysaccharide chain length determinant [Pseudomonadota bacterium]
MSGTIDQAIDLMRLFWHRRWMIFASAALFCLIGWPIVALLPNVYQSNAKVYLEADSMLRPLLKGLAVQSEARQEFANVARRTLLTRPNLLKVARDTDLDLQARDPEELEKLLIKIEKNIEVTGSNRENIYDISYADKDPELAKKVVEALLNIFMEGTLSAARQDTDVTQRFLVEQIAEYQQRLEEAEERLKRFRQENIGLMPSETGGYFQRLEAAKSAMEDARLNMSEAVNRRNELKIQLNRARSGETVGGEAGGGLVDERIAASQKRLDELRMIYTDQHPDVIAVKKNIEELKQQAAGEANKGVPTVQQNPAYHELTVELGKAEAEVASLQVRYQEYARRVEKLRALIDTIPAVEAELAKLNRDYNINKENYEALVSRRESAKIAQDVEKSTDQIQFRIIEPARVPILPSGPKRPLLYTVVLLAGLGLGLVVAYLLSEIKVTFYNARRLRESTGLPVLGTVSKVRTQAQMHQSVIDVAVYFAGLLVLLAVYGGLMYRSLVH